MTIDKSNPLHYAERNGRAMVLYAGLLDEAHRQGLKGIDTMLVQIPSDLNGHIAIVRASVETEKGLFTGIADASPDNVGRMVANALIRMAETRAKSRALRDAINLSEALADDPTSAVEAEDHDPFGSGGPTRSGGERSTPTSSSTRSSGVTPERSGGSSARPPLRELREEDLEGDDGDPGPEAPPVRDGSNITVRRESRDYSQDRPTGGGNRPGEAPATPKQLQTIQRMARSAGREDLEEMANSGPLSRAAASEIISNLIGELDGANSSRR